MIERKTGSFVREATQPMRALPRLAWKEAAWRRECTPGVYRGRIPHSGGAVILPTNLGCSPRLCTTCPLHWEVSVIQWRWPWRRQEKNQKTSCSNRAGLGCNLPTRQRQGNGCSGFETHVRGTNSLMDLLWGVRQREESKLVSGFWMEQDCIEMQEGIKTSG